MAFLSRSRLFGILLIVASLPMDPGVALATGMIRADAPSAEPPAGSVEARLRRIAEAVREQEVDPSAAERLGSDAQAAVFVTPGGVGWVNGGGFRNGGFANGGFGNGGFRNGGFGNGGFRNGGFANGGFRNGSFRTW
ncbi:MAG: rSAM-associated Gly-rich repeat protein [Cyanobacteria bacterium]|nr:rSAM-associated Gly-rich repeat protein [Cyanobacteriota bacterium]